VTHRIFLIIAAMMVWGNAARASIDFNSDGLADLLFQNQATGQIVYWSLDGGMYLNGSSLPNPTSSDWKPVDSADINGDGKPDLIYQNAATGQIAVWYMTGASFTGGGVLSLIPATNYNVVGTGDFNGDGQTDLVFQNSQTGQIVFWYLSGLRVIGGSTIAGLSLPFNPDNQVGGVADFNGDGTPDLVLQNRSTRGVSFLALQGVTVVGGATLPQIPASDYALVGIGDYNSDGKPDLLFQSGSSGQIVYWLLNHTTFSGGGVLPAPSTSGWRVGASRSLTTISRQSFTINGVSYVTTPMHESLTAVYSTPDGGVTQAGYQGYVLIHVTGEGISYGAGTPNDAFYIYGNQFSPPTNGHDGGYYQLAFSTTQLMAFDVGDSILHHTVNSQPPPYNPNHDYTVLVNTGLSAPGQLHFGVSDGGFDGNSGAYTITVTQLTAAP
jgi:hypothetical protein